MPHLFQVHKIKNLSMGRRSLRLSPAPRSCYQWTDGHRNDFSGVQEMSHRGSPVLSRTSPSTPSVPFPGRGSRGWRQAPDPSSFSAPSPTHTPPRFLGKKPKGRGGRGNHSDDNQKSKYLIEKNKIKSESLTISPEVGVTQSFDRCALRGGRGVPVAAKVCAD